MIWLPEEAFSRAFAQHASPLEQALLAATQRRVRSVPADHVPMITKASAVVDVVLEAVREVESNLKEESSYG